jgi:hypothetical protein
VHEGRAVVLAQDVRAHLDHVVGPQPHEGAVEGGVVQGAERQAVADQWLPSGCASGTGTLWVVRRVEEFLVAEATEGARQRS